MIELAGNLIVEDGKLLLLHREDEQHWEVPGGKVENEESPTGAAEREAEEEIGVEVSLEKPFYTGEFQHGDKIFLWHAYLADIENGCPRIEEDVFDDLGWFGSSGIEEIDLAPNIEMVLPALRRLLE